MVSLVRGRETFLRPRPQAASLAATDDVGAATAILRALPGIGEWTARHIAMRAFGDPDAFLHADLGLYKALGTTPPKETQARAEA